MTKAVDFLGASKRHYSDAEFLQSNGRDPNAGHLLGFSAECGIKALLVGLGYPTQPDGEMDSSYKPSLRTHVNVIQQNYHHLLSFVSGRSGGHYLSIIPNLGNFSDWDVKHRYYMDTAIPASLKKWESAAREVQNMIQNAWLDGVVR